MTGEILARSGEREEGRAAYAVRPSSRPQAVTDGAELAL